MELNLKRTPRWGVEGWYQQYKLRGVIEHKGETTKEGHYKDYVREGEKWTEWNDENSNDIPWEEVQKKQAYILICEKIEIACSEKCSVNKIVEKESTSTKENDDAIWIEMEFLKSPQKTIWKPKESNEMEIDSKGKKRRREEDRNIMLEPIETVTTKSEKRMKHKKKREKRGIRI